MTDFTLPVVIDIDSIGRCRAGIAGDNAPSVTFPCVVGRPKPGVVVSGAPRDYVGADMTRLKALERFNTTMPMLRGYVVDWDAMELVWDHAFYSELKVAPEEHQILLTEAALTPSTDREKKAQIMFETYRVPGMHIASAAELCLYAAKKSSGVVLQNDGDVLRAVPVYAGHELSNAVSSFYMSPYHTDHRQCSYRHWNEGQCITNIIHRSVEACDPDIRGTLYANVLIPGDMIVPGPCHELKKDLQCVVPFTHDVHVFHSVGEDYTAWAGGSRLACPSNFTSVCVSVDEYNEMGPSAINKK